jgi:hypothetical protein
MSTKVNESEVGDTAKLMIHRLIARRIRRDPTLVDRAKAILARQADQFEGWPFVREWEVLLSLPPSKLTSKLISRESGDGTAPQFVAVLSGCRIPEGPGISRPDRARCARACPAKRRISARDASRPLMADKNVQA